MKILFSNPPWWATQADGLIRAGIRAGSRWPFTMRTNSRPDRPVPGEYLPFPFFMGFAASYTQREFPQDTVIFRDSIARRESYDTYLNYVYDLKPDFIVIESATPSWGHDKHISRLLKEAAPSARVIVTGTITTTRSEEILAAGDCPVSGEYEKGVVAAIRGDWQHHPINLLSSDEMNAAPYPMFDEEVALAYWDACPTGQRAPQLQMWTSRGCPFKCCFCAWPATMTGNDPTGTGKRSVRYYSPEYVEGFIRHRLAINPTLQCVYLDDDTFNLSDRHALRIGEVMGRIGLPWSAMCRADTVKPATWKVMHSSGCFGVKIGMESGSQAVIDSIVNKRLDLASVEAETLPYLKSIGLNVHTTWTVGLPGETPAQAKETVDMITRLYNAGLHQTHQLSGTATIEGTPLDSIAQGKHLDAYPSATNDGLLITGDGQSKIEGIASRILQ